MTTRNRSVLFDSQVYAEQVHGGVSRYFSWLANALQARSRWEPTIFGGFHIGELPGIRKVGPSLRLPALPHTVRILRSMNRSLLRVVGSRLSADATLLHPTWYDMRTIELLAGPPLVITVHDLIQESWPEVTTSDELHLRRKCFERAKRIICVSRSTLERLDHFYGDRISSKAAVTYLGAPISQEVIKSDRPVDREYILFVGKRDFYKDFETLAIALSLLSDGPNLLVVGGGAPRTSELLRLDSLGLIARVSFVGYATDQELGQLIRGAIALVSTSREEGFGLPALEALALGTRVILTDIPVYRELFSEWAEFFPAGDAEALAELIATTSGSPGVAQGKQILERFSWTRAAELTETVYEDAISG